MHVSASVPNIRIAALALGVAGGCAVNIGPGLSDFRVSGPIGYCIYRSSTHQISVIPCDGRRDDSPRIPAKVIECDFNDRFLIAKRGGLRRRNENIPNDTYEEPDPKVLDFWILDASVPKVYGP